MPGQNTPAMWTPATAISRFEPPTLKTDPPSDLRTRIANALRNMTGDLTYEAMADAVIRELKLEPEYRFFPNDPPLARYVTEWEKADDE